MTDTKDVLSIIGEALDAVSGNVPAILNIVDLIVKSYHDIRNSPGDFDLKDFQDRLNNLPSYDMGDKNELQ